MRIVLFHDVTSDIGEILKLHLKTKGLVCVQSTNADQIDQAGKQNGKVVVIFTANKIPYHFLKNNKWPFKTMFVLYLEKIPALDAETKKKISEVDLKLYDEPKMLKLGDDVSSFFC